MSLTEGCELRLGLGCTPCEQATHWRSVRITGVGYGLHLTHESGQSSSARIFSEHRWNGFCLTARE